MSSGFVTEKEAEEKRRVRQEEWEKVRKPDDPNEAPLAPEQLPDRRTLYQKLKEQKDRKQEEFEEAHKLKNLVKVLDDEEADFLDKVLENRHEEERMKRMEEARELEDFRNKVAELREKDVDELIKHEIGLVKTEKKPTFPDDGLPSIGVKKTSQSKLLAGLVKRKSESSDISPEKKRKCDTNSSEKPESSCGSSSSGSSTTEIPSVPYKGGLVCIGVLPGLASYSSSDDSDKEDSTSDSEHNSPLRDLCGRAILPPEQAGDKCSTNSCKKDHHHGKK